MQPITIETIIHSPVEKVWEAWTLPNHITNWCHASDDWECPYAENDLRTDGKFVTRMSAKDGSASFDFNGIYTDIQLHTHIAYTIEDGRIVEILFEKISETETKVTETFDPEDVNPREMQQSGWQAILDNFKNYTESLG